MAFTLADRVRETSLTTGTGPFFVAGAAAANEATFASRMAPGDTTLGTIASRTANEWITGLLTCSSTDHVTVTEIFASSNFDEEVDFTSGTKDVFIGMPAAAVRPQLTPEMFGAKADLLPDLSNILAATNNAPAFARMASFVNEIGGGVDIHLQRGGLYRIWSNGSPAATLGTFSGANAVVINGNGATLYTDASSSDLGLGINLYVFRVVDCLGFKASNLTYQQAYRTLNPSYGAFFFFLQGATEGVRVYNCRQFGGVGFLACWRETPLAAGQARVRDVVFSGNITDVFYGITCSFSGDQVTGKLRCSNGGRAAILYNVHQIDLVIKSNAGSTLDDIEIAAYGSSDLQVFETQTSQIKIVYKNPSRVPGTSGNSICRLAFAQIDATPRPAFMRNIDLTFEVETGSAAQAPLVRMTKSTLAGVDTTTRGHRMHNITIGGYLTGQTVNNVIEAFTDGSDMTGEDVRNIIVRDLVLDGCNKDININAAGFSNLILENISAPGCNINVTNDGVGVVKKVGYGESTNLSW